MSRLEDLGVFKRPPDPRPEAEIDDDIAAELEFHLYMREQEGLEEGLPPEEARAEALRRFGDVERIRRSCLHIRTGERVMLQRLHFIVTTGLLCALVFVVLDGRTNRRQSADALAAMHSELSAIRRRLVEDSQQLAAREPVTLGRLLEDEPGLRRAIEAAAPAADPLTPEEWLARFAESEGWRAAYALGRELAGLPADEGLAVLDAIFHRIPAREQRQQVLKAFRFEDHPHILEVLHLGATDPELGVQDWAFQYLRDYAFRDFSEDYGAYQQWRASFRGAPLAVVLTDSARQFVHRLAYADRDELLEQVRLFGRLRWDTGDAIGVDVAQVMREAGLVAQIEHWLATRDAELAQAGLRWLSGLEPDEGWMRAHLLPLLSLPDAGPEIQSGVLHALGDEDCGWAREPLETYMLSLAPEGDGTYYSVASALGKIGDPRSVPLMIAMIVADDTYKTRYGVGYFGLGKLTGVPYDESHDAAWWLDWWQSNQERLPAEIRGLTIPEITLGR